MSTETATPPPASSDASLESLARQHFPSEAKAAAIQTIAASPANKAAEQPKEAPVKTAEQPKKRTSVLSGAISGEKPKETPSADTKSATNEKKPDATKSEESKADPGAPEDNMELPANASAESKSNFAKLKDSNKQLRTDIQARDAELQSLRNQIETLRSAAPADAEDVARIRAEHKALKERLEIQDIQNHPDYIARYIDPRDKALHEAINLLQEHGQESPDMIALLAKSRADFGKAAWQLAEQLPEFDRQGFMSSMREAYNKSTEAKEAMSQSSKLAEALRSRTAQQQRDAMTEIWNSAGENNEVFLPLEARDGATDEEKREVESYNAAIKSVRSNYEKGAFSPMTDKQVAHTVLKAATHDFLVNTALPRIEREYLAMHNECQRLQKEIDGLRAAKSPGQFGGSSPSGTAPTQAKSIDDLSKQFFPNGRT